MKRVVIKSNPYHTLRKSGIALPSGSEVHHRLIEDTLLPRIGSYAAGLMFWFTQKKFVGSYFFLMAARRP